MARIVEGGEGRRDELIEDELAEEDVYEVEDEDDYLVDEEELLREMEALGAKKRSRQREEIEAALKAAMERSDAGEAALILLNLDGGEAVYFDGYPEALEYMAEHKGRWYLAPRRIDRKAAGSRQEADKDRSEDRR
ncbi:hypothetical protein [Candidatus Methanocrinis natronophilus]|uniref:Uncharacterized protein n=1 Tax=Candidatus Methanocrinis natronophilus TaxID=3033396 RepID=A0ABT5X8Q9_9EURY|nr:hypothetical protein [Candidatus Methanocrinis natronophilus]MDF0591095.1 hypothetical protein [Candidatus Methanocrinis natronophilus]